MPRGPTYSLEYFRDNTVKTVVYILYKQINQSTTVKYYYVRAMTGQYNLKPFLPKPETVYYARPGHDMPLLSYISVPNTPSHKN